MCINQTIFKFQPKETTTVAQTSNDNCFSELPIFFINEKPHSALRGKKYIFFRQKCRLPYNCISLGRSESNYEIKSMFMAL